MGVTVGKLLKKSVPQFLVCKIKISEVIYLQFLTCKMKTVATSQLLFRVVVSIKDYAP